MGERDAISELILRHAHGVDTGDVDGLQACFTGRRDPAPVLGNAHRNALRAAHTVVEGQWT